MLLTTTAAALTMIQEVNALERLVDWIPVIIAFIGPVIAYVLSSRKRQSEVVLIDAQVLKTWAETQEKTDLVIAALRDKLDEEREEKELISREAEVTRKTLEKEYEAKLRECEHEILILEKQLKRE